ncbi:ribonuclease HI family protein [Staphylococcus ratti]|uniref:Ribonuclease HI family protein n=1 Tax=Staphylococcus ratti TaxID=2892440 RepID=A0ABY3PA48_9STAP|nr:ribonuclease HI family protein [Staphylococcus ratti]UEX89172.1 ribonuclease HI family protein [Staphylococcus ratti]
MAKIYFDAASQGNPGLSTYGVVIVEENKRYTFSNVLGEMENHEAEWEALLVALKEAKQLNIENALIHTDSKLIEDAVNCEFVKNRKYKHYLEDYLHATAHFQLCFVKWIPREQNKEANMLAQTQLYRYTKPKSKKRLT